MAHWNETGDIIVDKTITGHVLMVYDEGDDSQATVIHATGDKNFHIDPIKNGYTYKNDPIISNTYRPPWEKINYFKGSIDIYKSELKKIAAKIKDSAKYGVYRAVRLAMGSSNFDKFAKDRLDKYESRLDNQSEKFVSTVTCSEAVILCYQLAFKSSMIHPFFIKLDAAHAMPHTLESWLKSNGWEDLYNKK